MRGIGGCLLVMIGFFGFFIAIILSFTFYLLPLAFLVFIGSLILISFALGPAGLGRPEAQNKAPGADYIKKQSPNEKNRPEEK